MAPSIKDIWFRSSLPLVEIARRLELRDVIEDSENYWEWVISTSGEIRFDITRTHTEPPDRTDTRIFIWEGGEFSEPLIVDLVSRLRAFVGGTIACGRWEYRSDNDYDLVVVREFGLHSDDGDDH